jgi:hypothetical protein
MREKSSCRFSWKFFPTSCPELSFVLKVQTYLYLPNVPFHRIGFKLGWLVNQYERASLTCVRRLGRRSRGSESGRVRDQSPGTTHLGSTTHPSKIRPLPT